MEHVTAEGWGDCIPKKTGHQNSCSTRNMLAKDNGAFYKKFLVAQAVNNLPAMQEPQVQPLSWEDPQEKGMATHTSILAWRISWTGEPGGLQSMGS